MKEQHFRNLLAFYNAKKNAPRSSIPSRRHMKNMRFTIQSKRERLLAERRPVMRA